MEDSNSIRPKRSVFVTVVGWVFIAFAGFATLITALQNVMLHMMFPMEQIRQDLPDDAAFTDMPVWARWMMTHIELWFLFCFLVSALTLVAAVGLIRRHNWARVLLVAVLIFAVAWNLAGPFLAQGMIPSEEFAGVDDTFARMFVLVQIVTVLICVGLAALFGWIAWRLCSAPVRAEFGRE
jgi:hypothetical protein